MSMVITAYFISFKTTPVLFTITFLVPRTAKLVYGKWEKKTTKALELDEHK